MAPARRARALAAVPLALSIAVLLSPAEFDGGGDAGGGAWVPAAGPPPYPLDCPFLTDYDRCGAERTAEINRWRWRGHGDLAGLPDGVSPADVLRKCLSGRTLALTGDSISRQAWHSLQCLLWASGVEVEADKATAGLAVELWHLRAGPGPPARVAAAIGNVYLAEHTGTRPHNATVLPLPSPATRRVLALRPDIAVLSAGNHFDQTAQRNPAQDWRAATDAALDAVVLAARSSPGTRYIWRTVPVRHFRTLHLARNGSLSGVCDASPSPFPHAKPSDYVHGPATAAQNAMARARLRPAGFEIMDAAEISMPRGAAHRQGGDCSHYCLPGVPDAWAGVLLRMVWDRCGEGTAPD